MTNDRCPISASSNKRLTTNCYQLFLKCCFKRVRRMSDLRVADVGPDYRHHIKPRGRLRDAVAAEIGLGGLGELLALCGIHLIFGSGLILNARFYFDENQRRAVAGDDVDLSHRAAEVADDDFVAEVSQVPG